MRLETCCFSFCLLPFQIDMPEMLVECMRQKEFGMVARRKHSVRYPIAAILRPPFYWYQSFYENSHFNMPRRHPMAWDNIGVDAAPFGTSYSYSFLLDVDLYSLTISTNPSQGKAEVVLEYL
jgi:hypothetical protein